MARINIEDKLWSDPRFEFLLLKTGNEFVAIGMVVKAFRVAQKYWLKDQGLIPKNIWDAFGLSVLVDCDLAELIDGYIYVRGVAEQNDWLLKKQAAGKKSAESRLAQFGSNQPKKPEQCSSSVPNTSRTVFDPLEPPTPTPTPNLNTLPVSPVGSETGAMIKKQAKTKKPKSDGSQVWQAYSEAYREKYRVEHPTGMVANLVCKRLAGKLGLETAIEVARFYLKDNDPYVVKAFHPIGLLETRAQKYMVEISRKTGKTQALDILDSEVYR